MNTDLLVLPPCEGLVFDMDGTLVDNMRFHEQAWAAWHQFEGLPFDAARFFARTAGRTNAEIFFELYGPELSASELSRHAARKEALYRERARPHLAPLAGLLDLLDAADAQGLKLAVGTAAPPENVAFVLDTLGLRQRFLTVVHPGPGVRGKPHPDIFLEGARRLGLAPERCIVFEDAPLGIEAAARAAMPAVALCTMLAPRDFAGHANLLGACADFTAIRLASHA